MGFVRKTGYVSFLLLLVNSLLQRKEIQNLVLSKIKETGYDGELHHTVTEDGYILGIHRILKSDKYEQNSNEQRSRHPVLLVHGLESSPADWIFYHGKESLPYLLLEEGYDVWLGNIRGTQDSFNHTLLDPHVNLEQFWNTSIHEIGFFDLPAMVDYVLNMTQTEKLFYVGLSQGEATFLIMASERPEYNEKIKLALLTSPSSHLKYSDNVVMKSLGRMWPILSFGAQKIGLHTVPGRNLLGYFGRFRVLSGICQWLYSPFVGYSNPDQRIFSNELFEPYPIRSAFKQLIHYLQIFDTGIFRKFDYGNEGNLRQYGVEDPPEYKLEKIVAPVSYFWGENDCWSRPKDMTDIERKLPNMVLNYKIPNKGFNHYDAFLARDARKLIYNKMIETIVSYNHTK